MQKFIVELIGTFFLVLTVGACVDNPNPGVIAPVAIGGALMVMIFAGGHISGAHYNPAVTLAVTVRGRLPVLEAPWYFLAQLLGATGAAGIVFYLKGANQAAAAPAPAYSLGQCAVAEFLFTFALAYVVVNVATAKGTSGNSFYGLAIGSTVMVGAFAVGPISGGAFNPAVATGALYLGLLPVGKYCVYAVVELIAGLCAGLIFRMLNPGDK
ncbi:MAG TPA: aquaporin [Candidatus Methylacidiphilales bacterium]|nr:aquaporin [Candidatus Methylacidiphilales bacterium]